MKRLEKAIPFAGFLLILLSAFFLIAIFIQFLGPITKQSSFKDIFHVGKILFTTYNFSAFLIPLFCFIAGLCCFTTTWSDRKGFILFFSFIPFFTIVKLEKLCYELLSAETGTILSIKISALVTIGIMVLAIEYIIANIIGIKIQNWNKKRKDETYKYDLKFNEIKEDWYTTDLDEVIEQEELVPDESSNEISNEISNETELLHSKEEEAFFNDPFGENEEETIFSETEETQDEQDNFIPELEDETPLFSESGITEDIEEVTEKTIADLEAEYEESEEYEYTDAEYEDDENDEDDDYPEIMEETQEIEFDNDENNIENEGLDVDDVFAADTSFDFPFLEEQQESEANEKEQSLLRSMTVIANQQEQKAQQDDSAPLVERAVPARKKNAPYSVPTENLLTTYPDGEYWIIDDDTLAAAGELKDTLSEFKIEAEVTGIRKGPVITMFEILPAPGVKLSKIVALQDNIALRLAASSVRIVAPIPGKHAVGIEVPNKERAIVSFKELIETDAPGFRKHAIPVVLGKDITGEAQIIDLAKTPHLLIAGSTGSGKSVCVNTMILSILYKRSPQDVKMILIDPKIVELKLYNDIPHLLVPVITEPKKAFQALQYCLCEMERRYALLDGMGVRDITNYNHRIKERNIATEKLPYIVVIIDEFADLMATTGKELESTVARLAAMSRAVGIHLVLATQRPSIDVITGLIKANIPTRIAFMVASKMDSRIIIDQIGAEKLLGKGDMLYASATDPFPVRIQGTFVSDNEVENVVEFVKQYGEPEYIDDEMFVDDEEVDMEPGLFSDGDDPLYDQALEIVLQAGKASASYIQRRLKIGYNRAARLVEEMEARGIVGPANGSKPRDILHMP